MIANLLDSAEECLYKDTRLKNTVTKWKHDDKMIYLFILEI